MDILVTGANGFIGSHLVEFLVQRGHSVRCFVRRSSNLQWLDHLPVHFCFGDLLDRESIEKAAPEADIIYHVAGVSSTSRPKEYYRGNAEVTRNLLLAVQRVNPRVKRIVLISAISAVGPAKAGRPVNEMTQTHPITAYGRSKLEAEEIAGQFMSQLPITIIRPPMVYGPRGRDMLSFLWFVKHGLCPIIGLGSKHCFSLVYVTDLIQGIILASESDKAIGQTYFISAEDIVRYMQVGTTAGNIMGKRVIPVLIPSLAIVGLSMISDGLARMTGRPSVINRDHAIHMTQSFWTCSVAKAKRDLGYHQMISLEAGLKQTIEWYRQRGWL